MASSLTKGPLSSEMRTPEMMSWKTTTPTAFQVVTVLRQLPSCSKVAVLSGVEGPGLVLGCDDPEDDSVLGAEDPMRGQSGG